jgi:hypothetical protein
MTSRTLLVSSCALASSVLLAGGAAADPPDLATPSIDAAPPSVTNSQAAHFEFSSTDVGVTFSCSLDGEPFLTCVSPQDYESLLEGGHTFAVMTSLALEESSAATHNWLIDLTSPAVTLGSPADGSVASDDTPAFEGSGGTGEGDEAEVTVEVWAGADTTDAPVLVLAAAVDPESGAWSTTPGEALPDGSYAARARQADAAGNIGVSTVVAFTVDGTPPALTLTSPTNGSATRDQTPPFEGFGGTAEGDGVEVKIELRAGSDAGAPPVLVLTAAVDAATGAWSAVPGEPLPAGIYSVQATQADALGNSAVRAASFAVDTAPPVFAAVGASQVIEQTAPAGAVATYGPPATDELDPAPKVNCSPPSGAIFPAGVTTVSCRATDWAGNSAETQFTVTVANTIRPAPVQGLRAQAAKSRVGLSWKSPAEWDYDRLVVRRAPRETSMWRVVYEGRLATTFTDRDVQNDTEYVYEAAVYDTAGNVSASVSTQARPSAFLSPRWNAALRRPPTLRWVAVRKAAYYNVQLWRNGRKVLSRWPSRSRFRLQKTWRHEGRRYSLRDGTYFAYAWPGLGPRSAGRYGRLIGWTKFRIY